MKKSLITGDTMKLISALLLVVFLTTTTFAQRPIQREEYIRNNDARIEQNISANLGSKNLGVQSSTIQLIIDLSKAEPKKDLDYTVIPLMDLLKSSEHEEIRILAALGLFHLNSELGQFAVLRRADYDESTRVANMCKRITQEWERTENPAQTQYTYTTVEGL